MDGGKFPEPCAKECTYALLISFEMKKFKLNIVLVHEQLWILSNVKDTRKEDTETMVIPVKSCQQPRHTV